MSKTTGSQQEYLDKNRWFITASKLKYFLTYWPEAYYYKYVKEIILEEKEKDYYLVGTAFDDLVSFREDKFFDKYYIDDGSLKEDLVKRCDELGIKYQHNGILAIITAFFCLSCVGLSLVQHKLNKIADALNKE